MIITTFNLKESNLHKVIQPAETSIAEMIFCVALIGHK